MNRYKVKNSKKFAALFCIGIVLLAIPICPTKENIKINPSITDDALYLCAGLVLYPVSYLSRLAWTVSLIFPRASSMGNEFLLFSHLCYSSANDVLGRLFHKSPSPNLKGVRPSHSSWYLNKLLLSNIPAFSDEEKQLLFFLEKHWLAKVTGFYPLMVNWVCPCFDKYLQVHPETTSSYSRNPSNKFSQTYTDIVKDWKRSLPHPQHYPLILTRPFDIHHFLPTCLNVLEEEHVQTLIAQVASHMQSTHVHPDWSLYPDRGIKPIVDLTHVFPKNIKNQKEWMKIWEHYRTHVLQRCKEYDVDPHQVICIQRIFGEAIGAIRILPLVSPFEDQLESHFQYLLEWISTFGLSANRIELDRYFFSSDRPPRFESYLPQISRENKEEFLSYLTQFHHHWKSDLPHETLLVEGTLQVLEGLLTTLTEKQWNDKVRSPARSHVTHLSFLKIKNQLETLLQKKKEIYFFDTMEQIHAELSALLEIFTPFSIEDFPSIYREILTIPNTLKSLTSCGVHASGMTSLTSIFKAVEKSRGSIPRVLYGENTYFECIHVAERISRTSAIAQATEEDLRDADLILGQFHPALRRIDFEIAEYQVEKIAETLHKVLNTQREKPLTLALDCTLDFINSPHISSLFQQFQQEIAEGILNIVCYRSGVKFDIFGMDNYCGAPFFMVHSEDKQWAHFDLILNDPAVQTDRLSLNWFCLAYKYAANSLELYRKQIFDNTRTLLNKIPQRLFDIKRGNYRVVPIEEDANSSFIDIKIFGPFHAIRGPVLAGGCLYLKCMKGGHPIFYRPSLGLYHPNFSVIFCDNFTTIRLTLGLDPAQIDILAKSIELIDALERI